MAPEVIRYEPYNEKCDIYSFAIILNELVTGDHPYIETDHGPSKVYNQSCKVLCLIICHGLSNWSDMKKHHDYYEWKFLYRLQ